MNAHFRTKVWYCLTLLIFLNLTQAQNLPKNFRTSLDTFEKALQSKDASALEDVLDAEFKVADYGLPTAIDVIEQILAQYPKLTRLKVTHFADRRADINYLFEQGPEQTSGITFSNSGKILTIELFNEIMETSRRATNPGFSKIASFTTPFELDGGLIYVKAVLNGEEQDFILDSGAPGLILNSQYLASESTGQEVGGVSGSTELQNIAIQNFDWNGIAISETTVIGLALSHLERNGRRIAGLIGFSLISQYEMLIDYETQQLSIFDPDESEYHTTIKPIETLNFALNAHIPVFLTEIEGHSFKFGLDTGAEVNLMDPDSFEKLPANSYETGETTQLSGADNRVTNVTRFSIHETVIESSNFENMEFISSDISHLKEGYQLDIDGLVGFPFLSSRKMSVNFNQGKLYIWE